MNRQIYLFVVVSIIAVTTFSSACGRVDESISAKPHAASPPPAAVKPDKVIDSGAVTIPAPEPLKPESMKMQVRTNMGGTVDRKPNPSRPITSP